MKLFLILLLTSGCAVNLPNRSNSKKEKNHVEKVRECVETLMSKHGVIAKDALVVCEQIYRRK